MGFGRRARTTLVAILVSLWGARLTFNFARKGGYARGGEDYRWPILRHLLPGWRFATFNLLFIAIYQNALLLLLALPVWTVAQHPGPLTAADAVAAVVFVLLLAGETVADQQRWNFHRRHPDGGVSPSGVPHSGVLQTGLFRYGRHPNYFFEIAQWWVVVEAPHRRQRGPPADPRRACPQDVTPRDISTSRCQPWLRPSTPTRVDAMITSLVPAVRVISHWRVYFSLALHA